MCVETEDDLAELDPVPVDQRTLPVNARQLLVVHYYRVGLRKIRDRPMAIGVGEPRVTATHRARLQSHVLRRSRRISPENQLGWLAGRPDKPYLAMAGLARENLETPRKELQDFFHRAIEPHCLRRLELVGATVVGMHSVIRARAILGRPSPLRTLRATQPWLFARRKVADQWRRRHRHLGFEGLGPPGVLGVRWNDERKTSRRRALLRSPLHDHHDRRKDDREKKYSDDGCNDDWYHGHICG